MSRTPGPAVAFASACLSLWLALPAGVGASHHGQGVADEIALRMSYQQAPVAGAHAQVVVQAAIDNGTPAVGVDVEFLRQIDFLGPRLINLGSATTDASGTARITLDTSLRKLRVIARVTASDLYLAAEAAEDIDLPAVPDGASPDGAKADGQPNLAIVAAVMPPLLAALGLSIWLLLCGLIAVTVLAIRRDRPIVSIQKEGRS